MHGESSMKKNKKQRIKLKRLKMKHRRLIKQYPWLLPRNVWTDKVPEDYDHTYIAWYGWPRGWNIAFGDMFLKEFGEAVKEAGLERTLRIYQMKEKYGSMRCYINKGTEKMYRIIDKYEHISENVCIACGKPDVPVINDGWISPWCFDCWRKNYKGREKWLIGHKEGYEPIADNEIWKMYDESICDDDAVIAGSYRITRFSKDGNKTEIYDISDTVKAVRERWDKRKHGRNPREFD